MKFKSSHQSRRAFLLGLGVAAALPVNRALSAAATLVTNSTGTANHRILSCNILLKLPEHSGKFTDWDANRREACFTIIKSRKPDIACLQEVGGDQYADIIKAFPEYVVFGYPDPYVDNEPKRFQEIKNVIIFSRKRYQLSGGGTYWLSETPHVPGSILKGTGLPRHVTWVRLNDTSTGREFRILNTHFALEQPIRAREAEIIVKETSQYSDDFPQILAGDFNSIMTSPEQKILFDAGWQDSYYTIKGTDSENTGHGYKGAEEGKLGMIGRRIDCVFCKGAANPVDAGIIRDKHDGIFPSDHHFVFADVQV